MSAEFESLINLESFFDEIRVRNLRSQGAKGLMPMELSFKELIFIAARKGYKCAGIQDNNGMISFQIMDEEGNECSIYSKGPAFNTYIVDNELETLRVMFTSRQS